MPIFTSANGTLPLTLRAGETLVVRNYTGTEIVTGSTAVREDASTFLGAGAVCYGPQSSAASLTLSTSGVLDYNVVAGDATPSASAGTGGGVAVKRTNRMSHRVFGCFDMAAMASGFTWQDIFAMPLPVGEQVILRAKYACSDAANNFTVAGVAWAAGTDIANSLPKLADGATNAAFQVVVSTGLANTFAVPVAPNKTAGVMGVAYSPWSTPITPLARVDGGAWPAIYLRTLATAAGSTVGGITGGGGGSVAASPADYATAAVKAQHVTMIKSGDFVTTNQTGFTSLTSANYNASPVVEIEAILLRSVLTIANVGDSTACATGATGSGTGYLNYVQRMVDAIASPTNPVGQIEMGYIGALSSYSHGKLGEMLADNTRVPPSIVVMMGYSRNDDTGAFSQAALDAGYMRALQSADKCWSLGSVPVLRTAIPDSGITTTAQEDRRVAYNTQIRNSGQPYFDFDLVCTDGGYPARIKAGFDLGDGIHLTAAAHAAGATRLLSDLRKFWLL